MGDRRLGLVLHTPHRHLRVDGVSRLSRYRALDPRYRRTGVDRRDGRRRNAVPLFALRQKSLRPETNRARSRSRSLYRRVVISRIFAVDRVRRLRYWELRARFDADLLRAAERRRAL